jgi:hypothetical protein
MSHIDLSKLKWAKVIHDPSGWAYTRDRIKRMFEKSNGVKNHANRLTMIRIMAR